MYRVPLKIMGVKPLSSNDQMISDAKLFPTRSPRYPVCFPKASAAGPVSLNGHSLHWLSRRWLTGLSGVFGIFFCGKCFTTSFLMSYEPQKRHPGGPWSFITRVNEASLSFGINISSVLQMVCKEKQLEVSCRAHCRNKQKKISCFVCLFSK